MSAPLCIDLFCGLGGWAEGFLSEGYQVVGFDIERHVYGAQRFPGELVIQDVLTLHGAQFRDAAVIVASPPCQEFSYMAMPWTRAKEKAKRLREGPPEDRATLTALFDACFRIQREAIAAAGHHIPLVVENVCGAQKWVGRAKWHFGSYYLWGDVPALMPVPHRAQKVPGFRFDGRGESFQTASVDEGVKAGDRNKGRKSGTDQWSTSFAETLSQAEAAEGFKTAGLNWSNREQRGQDFTRIAGNQADRATKNSGGSWFNVAHNTTSGVGQNPDGRHDAAKQGGSWFHDSSPGTLRSHAGKSTARKAASARIAKIPFALSSFIAQTYHPGRLAADGAA
jgi:hypothetical protein